MINNKTFKKNRYPPVLLLLLLNSRNKKQKQKENQFFFLFESGGVNNIFSSIWLVPDALAGVLRNFASFLKNKNDHEMIKK